jgi:hypothetical protein
MPPRSTKQRPQPVFAEALRVQRQPSLARLGLGRRPVLYHAVRDVHWYHAGSVYYVMITGADTTAFVTAWS